MGRLLPVIKLPVSIPSLRHMKILAFVSDESYLALVDVRAEFESRANGSVWILSSSPRGAFYGDLPPGSYRVTLAKPGYGAKRVECQLGSGDPYQFRLLSDN